MGNVNATMQVNADIKKYRVGDDGVPRLVSVDTSSVGRDISTKAVGSNKREDLTDNVSPTRAVLRGLCITWYVPAVQTP